MVKKSKLISALDQHKGRDYEKEHQKKLRKQAEKRKRAKKAASEDVDVEEKEQGGMGLNGAARDDCVESAIEANGTMEDVEDESEQDLSEQEQNSESERSEDEEEDWSDEEEINLSRLDDESSSDSDDDSDIHQETPKRVSKTQDSEVDASDNDEEDEDEDIPLSDIASLASEEKGDIIPHQRLTINNTAALMAALNRISLDLPNISFSLHQSITSDVPISIPDVDDDLNRELAFYKQSLDTVKKARALLKKEGVPFTRPGDYFAEMVKSDEHMDKVKQKLVDEAARKRAAADMRKQRDLKKFGKAVQVAKQQERDKAKRETLEKINALKRKRASAPLANETEADIFDVGVDDELSNPSKRVRSSTSSGPQPNKKRQKKNEKYGFGGKKRHAKSNDAASSANTRGFSINKMKAGFGGKKGGASKRPGKSRRAKMK